MLSAKHLLHAICLLSWTALFAVSPSQVIVVANENDPLSKRIAATYIEARGIPEVNLILLDAPRQETISWEEFSDSIYNPLRQKLAANGWINLSWLDKEGDHGREQAIVFGHQIDFLVACRLPLRIRHRDSSDKRETDAASVDGELAQLAAMPPRATGGMKNPLFGQMRPNPALLQQVVRVTRLDGPSFDVVENMIGGALRAEKFGLRGRAYIDPVGGPAKVGSTWLEDAGKAIESLHYPTDFSPQRFSLDDRIDAPAFYFGWYSHDVDGPFGIDQFRFSPGAIAMHIHSFSASSLRRLDRNWTAHLISRGAAFSLGNVYEPFLSMSHRPDIFALALQSGMTTGEAAYAALPVLSWMATAVGDPLYRPFNQSLAMQLERVSREEFDEVELDQYVIVREIQRRIAIGDNDGAITLAASKLYSLPGTALAFDLFKRWPNQLTKVQKELSAHIFEANEDFSLNEVILATEMARQLSELGMDTAGLDVMKKVVQSEDLPIALRIRLLKIASGIAGRASDFDRAAQWGSEHKSLQAKQEASKKK